MAKFFKQIIIFFALLAVLMMTVQSAPPREACGENEEFVTCGTSCPLTCEKRTPGICTYQCFIGCQCKDGFFRNSEYKCVAESEC
uniref:Uncharacterized protein n=1 Tax=Musca domestica TaxID=7370 RepID=A0A1I8N1M2_MUSDO